MTQPRPTTTSYILRRGSLQFSHHQHPKLASLQSVRNFKPVPLIMADIVRACRLQHQRQLSCFTHLNNVLQQTPTVSMTFPLRVRSEIGYVQKGSVREFVLLFRFHFAEGDEIVFGEREIRLCGAGNFEAVLQPRFVAIEYRKFFLRLG